MHLRRLFALLLLLAAACASSAGSNSATPTPTSTPTPTPTGNPSDPGTPGPYAVSTSSANIPGGHADTAAADIYLPDGAGPYPVVFLAHGFGRSKAQHTGNGAHVASWGFVTVVPNMLHGSDHAKNGEDLVAFATWAQGHPSELGAAADPSRLAVMGHSAGGLSSTLASKATSPFQLLVGLDPVDASSLGINAAPSVTIPAAYVVSEPASCNASGNGVAMWDALGSTTRERLRIVGATHCDFEDPTDGLCTSFCGTWDATRHTVALRYATAWLLDQLAGDHTFAPWTLGGASMAADASITDSAHTP